jgi:hypothetical protein
MPACTERGPDGELLTAGGHPNEQQIGNIYACDGEDESDGSK